ncbi:MAG TPA: cupredoxin domain-containing protein [Actinomycetota bacterium]|nr:cupredoxin domain-containing protein [Actinomycetota bacterium]
MRSTTIRRLVALAAILLLAAACGGSGGGEDSGGAGAAAGSKQGGGYYGGGGLGTETGPTAPTGATGDAGEAGAGGASLSVALNNYLFDPARIEVESGATIDLQNANANTPHTFTVRGTEIDVSLEPLTSDSAVIDIEPGTYTVICRLHTSFDMEAELTVT